MAVRHFYVDSNNGTNTGTTDTSSASRETGAMSSLPAGDIYDRLGRVLAIAVPPNDGDFIYIADNHSAAYNHGNNVTINSAGADNGAGLQIISVDRSNVENYLPGAYDELNDGADDFQVLAVVFIAGVDLKTSDNVLTVTAGFAKLLLQDATVNISTTAGDIGLLAGATGASIRMVNVDINASNAGNNAFNLAEGAIMWQGGKLVGTAMTGDLIKVLASAEQAYLHMVGIDLSTFTGQILLNTTTAMRNFLVRLDNCQLNTSVTPYGTLAAADHRFEMYGCDDGTNKKLYRLDVADGTGSAKNNDSIYVTATESWYGGTDKSSIQVDTTALCSHALPFVFELPAQYIDLAVGTTDTLTLELVTAETLVKHDVAAFLVYPDGTTAVTPVWVSSGPSVGSGNYGIDPLDTSTAMPASALGAGDWTGEPGTPNFYELVLDTSGTPGQAAAVSVRIEVYKASIGPIYIHPLITVSAT